MAHVKVLTPSEIPLFDLLGPLPKEAILPCENSKDLSAWALGQLKSRLEEGLKSSRTNLTLVLPPGLIDTIADNVIQVAMDEPCGLRGSVLRIILADEWPTTETLLVEVKADLSTPTTHQLEVTLRPDPVSWYTKMSYIFRSFTRRRVVISPKYELVKLSVFTIDD
ncbi:UNVERIFIED_CONTAM: hypothetical protein RMT77_016786 [Armadillidium vulgare]|uniref:Protein scylla n=1 Tax=Armadillidium nasatum TaxID=96803 RepID=A0A5N5SKU0_9CRUS|nr:Protein scylla [Armadillidium nasatum]RXG69612.1 hypothetical protein Avbf_07341 [Armadillidium vulgare]